MSFTVTGKTALITGANRGIGLGFVNTLLNEGVARIYASARQTEDLAMLKALNPQVIQALPLDITQADSIQAFVEQIEQLDILINNAGIVGGARCGEKDNLAIARQEMEVNLFGPMQLNSALLPLLKQSKAATIINIASIAAIYNFPAIGTYSVSKAAMQSYTQGLRADLATAGINVIGVYPGPHDTRLAEGMEMEKPAPDNVAQKTLTGLAKGENDIYPDDFAMQMNTLLQNDTSQLATLFTQMSE